MICAHCGQDKPKNHYHKHRDGIRKYCRDCATTMTRRYRATGSCNENMFSGLSIKKLIALKQELDLELKNRKAKLR